MSPEPGVPVLLRGRAAWQRTFEVKERFLAAGDPDLLPPETCGVRREIVLSWRRSLLSGVDAASTDLPRDEGAVPPDRLVRAAQPVVDRLADQLAGMPVWAFLADRECRLVRYVVGDPALTRRLEARGAFPGALFGEDIVGTNGLGTAVEQQRPFIVAGSEHFRAYEGTATTAGAPVRDPVTRRLVGLLNVNCPYELTNGLLLPFVTELARSIEARLLAGRVEEGTRPSAPVATARRRPPEPRSPWERLLEQLARARATRLPLLLRGERGTGKTTLARRLHDQAGDGGPCTVLDAAAACGTRPGDWLGRLHAALTAPAGTVVLQHLDALDPALAARTASLPVSPQVRLVATAAHRTVSAGRLAALVERFPVVLDVPPVRERTADIPALVTELIEELRPRPPRPRCTAEALAALAAHEWPGNIRQLRQVVTTALVRSMSCDITLDDLPGEYAGRHLTKLERAERAALLTALRDAAWDREAAARDLGISRATIYRKLKRFGIRPPTGHVQEDIG